MSQQQDQKSLEFKPGSVSIKIKSHDYSSCAEIVDRIRNSIPESLRKQITASRIYLPVREAKMAIMKQVHGGGRHRRHLSIQFYKAIVTFEGIRSAEDFKALLAKIKTAQIIPGVQVVLNRKSAR